MQKRYGLRSTYQDIMKAIGKEITLNFIRSKLSENIDQLFKRECESIIIILIK